MTSLLGVPVDAAYHLIVAFAGVLTPVGAIIMFTVAVRLLLLPLSLRAMRAQAIQARLAPQVSKLRTKYGKRPERLQQELTALYKREGTSLFAGFSPLLLQWPFLSVLYLLFRSPVIGGRTNTLLTHDLLGVPLGRYWLGGAGPASMQGLVFLGVFALLAAACWLSARLARALNPASAVPVPAVPVPGGLLIRVLPYITVVIAAFAPLAGAIYLVTSTAWSAAERRLFAFRPDRPQHRATRVARRSLPDGPANRVSPGR
ncbi:MAG TPA: membrane protein insertase YidC [Streptosporangiaceae bacterium]|nr:membrane protein insertase YidC [Streptosporangiaceae bacterium]